MNDRGDCRTAPATPGLFKWTTDKTREENVAKT